MKDGKSGTHPGSKNPEGQIKKVVKQVDAARGTPYEQAGGYGSDKRSKMAEEEKMKKSYIKSDGHLYK